MRGHRLKFPKHMVFLSMMINFVLENSADPDGMLHYAECLKVRKIVMFQYSVFMSR